MKSYRTIEALRRTRKAVVWNLLDANNAPEVIGILHTHLNGRERQLPASVLVERVELDFEELRAHGDHFPETAQQYIANWTNSGYLRCDRLPGSLEDVYELSAGAVAAIHFVLAIDRPQSSATESRLSIVLSQLSKLAEDTDTDTASRLRRLNSEKARIEEQIEQVECGSIRVLPHHVALERLREIFNLANDLTSDFRRVKDHYISLHKELRDLVMTHEGGRGEVLQLVFDGLRSIEESDPGRTFSGFWHLLNDPVRSSSLDGELEDILQRKFATKLTPPEKTYFRGIKRTLLEQSDSVRSEFKHFSESLEKYVRSTDYMEQRRMTALIKEAQRSALVITDTAKPYDLIGFSLKLTSSTLTSMILRMHDPSEQKVYVPMTDAEESSMSLAEIGGMFLQSDVDMRALRADIADVLSTRPAASIGEILLAHPAQQGLGTVLGLIEIGSREGVSSEERETVDWIGSDSVPRRGDIPYISFVKGHFHEQPAN